MIDLLGLEKAGPPLLSLVVSRLLVVEVERGQLHLQSVVLFARVWIDSLYHSSQLLVSLCFLRRNAP